MEVITIESEVFNTIMHNQKVILEKLSQIENSSTLTIKLNWLSLKETAKALDVSMRTMQTYRDIRLIGFSQIKGKIYFKTSDIHDFMINHYVPAVSTMRKNKRRKPIKVKKGGITNEKEL